MNNPIIILALGGLIAVVAMATSHQRKLNVRRRRETGEFDYSLNETFIEVVRDDKYFLIPRSKFEQWLIKNHRLDYCHDYNDPSQFDGHGQQTGTYTLDQYWKDLDDSYIKEDILMFIEKVML